MSGTSVDQSKIYSIKKPNILESVPWIIVQSLNSRIDILCASALLCMRARARARTHTQAE